MALGAGALTGGCSGGTKLEEETNRRKYNFSWETQSPEVQRRDVNLKQRPAATQAIDVTAEDANGVTAEVLGLSWVWYLTPFSLGLITCRLLRLCPQASKVLLLIYLIGLLGSSACPGVVFGTLRANQKQCCNKWIPFC